MMGTPCRTKSGYFFCEGFLDAAEFRELETVALPQLQWPAGTIQDEDRFSVAPFHVNMRGTVIVGIDHDA
jgi:hypothetical protein